MYDVAFLQNALILWYARDTHAEPDDEILGAVRSLAELWAPRRCILGVAPPGADATLDDARSVEVDAGPEPDPDAIAAALRDAARSAAPESGWRLRWVGPALDGWTRIGIPDGADVTDEWTLVSDEGFVARDYEVRQGPELAGVPTVWIRLSDVGAASDVSVFADPPGEATARLTLGATLFAPGADPRPDYVPVRGVPLRRWHEANAALLAAVDAELRSAQWTPGRS